MSKFAKVYQIVKKQRNKLNLFPDRILATDIIINGLNNERAARIMEKDNTLTFKCRNSADRKQIKKAFVELYGEAVYKVNVANTVKGYKKAYIRLRGVGAALKVARDANIL